MMEGDITRNPLTRAPQLQLGIGLVILQCRDIDMDSLQGILVDHACLVDPYILNREAEMIQWKLLLVDGAHWNGMKKLRKQD